MDGSAKAKLNLRSVWLFPYAGRYCRVDILTKLERVRTVADAVSAMRLRHQLASELWPRWVKHYEATGGFAVHLAEPDESLEVLSILDPAEIFSHGRVGLRRYTQILGVLDYRAERDSGSINWFARKYSLLSSNKQKCVLSSPPLRSEEIALVNCYWMERTEFDQLATSGLSSYSETPILPINCRAPTAGDLERLVDAQLGLEQRFKPKLYEHCERIASSDTKNQYDELLAQVPFCELLDHVMLCGKKPAEEDVPKNRLGPVQNAIRRANRRSLKMLRAVYGYAEFLYGYVRRGYCFMPHEYLTRVINRKTGNTFSPKTFAKQRERLGLFSLITDHPRSVDGL